MTGLMGIIRGIRMIGRLRIVPTARAAMAIGKVMRVIKRPIVEARKIFPFRPDLAGGAKREWAKYVTKQFYAPQAGNLIGKAVEESIPIWQRVAQKPLIP